MLAFLFYPHLFPKFTLKLPQKAIYYVLFCPRVRPILKSITINPIKEGMKKVEYRKIPNNLRKYRKAIGLKQKEVARILGLKNAGMISRWENGVCLPSLINAIRLSGLYSMLVDALFHPLIRLIKRKIMERQEYLKRAHG
jgi:DNA-binding XRE family transcriptional regulator